MFKVDFSYVLKVLFNPEENTFSPCTQALVYMLSKQEDNCQETYWGAVDEEFTVKVMTTLGYTLIPFYWYID